MTIGYEDHFEEITLEEHARTCWNCGHSWGQHSPHKGCCAHNLEWNAEAFPEVYSCQCLETIDSLHHWYRLYSGVLEGR